jgi:peptidylprolyl isomerase domain and WD repeat-containing protein 1
VYEAAELAGTLGVDSIDFGRRRAVEAELMSSADAYTHTNVYFNPKFTFNAIFDESGQLLIYATTLGVKIVSISSNRDVRLLHVLHRRTSFLFAFLRFCEGCVFSDLRCSLLTLSLRGAATK